MKRTELVENIYRKGSFLCVGLDPDIKKLPACITGTDAERVATFCKAIVDTTAPYCVAYKPNLAFFESLGADGIAALAEVASYIRTKYPDQFIIADAKRGDIGNTSRLYARSFFEHLDLDAVTVAPYMGSDSVSPFLGYEGKWVILLALTSNPGSADFQMIEDIKGQRLFERVLETSREWASSEEMMYVVGATRGQLLEDVRRIVPDSFLLVPGVGAQGGSLEEVVRYGITPDCGLLVNSSRGIIFASNGIDFADAAAEEARKLRDQMALLLEEHGI